MGGRKKPRQRMRPAGAAKRPTATLGTEQERASLIALWSALSIDLLHKDYAPTGSDLSEFSGVCRAHCYICAEVAYHLFGKAAGYKPFVHKHAHGSHWWLQHTMSHVILDPSLPQHDGPYPYHLGKPGAFRTRTPSKRAAEVISRIIRKNAKHY